MEVLNQNDNFQCSIIEQNDLSQNINILNPTIYQTIDNKEINNNQNKQQLKEPLCTLDKFLPDKNSKFKKTLVLDLDETLIHSNFLNINNSNCDFSLDINFENRNIKANVLKRPGVDEFLNKMSNLYEIVIFTASLSQYAIPLIEQLDKNKVCSFKLFREHCSFINNGYTKDLKRLNRNMNDIIIVDNTPNCYVLNNDNGFPIKSWLNDINDRELIRIIPYLEFLSNVDDVRKYIPKMKTNFTFSYEKADLVLEEEKRKEEEEKRKEEEEKRKKEEEERTKIEEEKRKEEEEKERIQKDIERKEKERKNREEEVLFNDMMKEKESKVKELELKKIEEIRRKEIRKKFKIEKEKKMKELEQSLKEENEIEKKERINLVQIIDYSNKNKMSQSYRNAINFNNLNLYNSNIEMPKIFIKNSINSSINNSTNNSINHSTINSINTNSLQTLNSFRISNKNLIQINSKNEENFPQITFNQNIKANENPIYNYSDNNSKKSFKLTEKISFDDLKMNVSKNKNNINFQNDSNVAPKIIQRHITLKNSNIHILYNTKKKLYLKKKEFISSENSEEILKKTLSNRQRNATRSFNINDIETKLFEFEKNQLNL